MLLMQHQTSPISLFDGRRQLRSTDWCKKCIEYLTSVIHLWSDSSVLKRNVVTWKQTGRGFCQNGFQLWNKIACARWKLQSRVPTLVQKHERSRPAWWLSLTRMNGFCTNTLVSFPSVCSVPWCDPNFWAKNWRSIKCCPSQGTAPSAKESNPRCTRRKCSSLSRRNRGVRNMLCDRHLPKLHFPFKSKAAQKSVKEPRDVAKKVLGFGNEVQNGFFWIRPALPSFL